MSVPQTATPPQLTEPTPPVFTCQQCGGCCSNITVLVNATQKNALLARPWIQEHLAQHVLTLEKIDKEHWGLPLKSDGTCVFLDDAQMCLIQQHDGYDAKPPDCKYFPFSKRITGVSTVDTSAACQTVAGGLLAGTHHWQPDEISTLNPTQAELPQRIPTGYGTTLTQATYTQWMAAIRAQWCDTPSAPSPTQALRWLHTALPKNNPQHPIAAISPAPFRPFVERLLPTLFGRAPYGIWTRYGVWCNEDICDPRVFGKRGVSLAGLAHVAWPTPQHNPALNQAACHFLFTLMQRKMPIVYGHSLKSQLLLCTVALGLVQWYARIFALMAAQAARQPVNNATVTSNEVVLAFRVVERYYTGHQPVFPERMRRWPLKGATLAWLLG